MQWKTVSLTLPTYVCMYEDRVIVMLCNKLVSQTPCVRPQGAKSAGSQKDILGKLVDPLVSFPHYATSHHTIT